MALNPGTRLGPYEVVSAIGAGGMGEVYRARDTRLKREVAIKVLPASVAHDDERLRRFEQEALATAALNHPNILVVFDIGRLRLSGNEASQGPDADTTYVALELLEGRTLRDVINDAAVPVRKAVDYATQIALGLAAAHGKAIVHRDLKPENLFVTTEDRIKILDFGLAKVVDASSASGATSTVLAAATEPGMVVGTIGYMAPEQVRGLATDHRADIFSFGAVLYELLTGARAFRGDTPADTMTAILKEAPPDPSASGRQIPAGLSRVVERCLEKQPAARFQSASDLAFALQALGSDVRTGSGIDAVPALSARSSRNNRTWLVAGAALVLGGAIAALAMKALASPPPPSTFVSLEVAAPAGWRVHDGSAISPDGSRLAFAATNAQGERRLWIRPISGGPSTLAADSLGAYAPFWSPDSTKVAFFTNDRLRGLRIADGHGWVICDVKGARRSGTWNADDIIVFSTETNIPVRKVNAEGGTAPEPVGDVIGFRPFFLPDGRHFLLTPRPSASLDIGGIVVVDLATGKVQPLREDGGEGKFANGNLIFVLDRQLMAQPFDPTALTLSGAPVPIGDVGVHTAQTGTNFSVARSGLIAFAREPEARSAITWYTREGLGTGVSDPGYFGSPEFSPDDRVAAVVRVASGTQDLVTLDAGGLAVRQFASGTTGRVSAPIWSANGSMLRFLRLTSGAQTFVMLEKPIDGGSERPYEYKQPSNFSTPFYPVQITAKGMIVAFAIRDGNRDLLTITPGGEARAFAQTTANETQPALSPSERWMAYVSDAEGGDEAVVVWIEAFPEGGKKTRASANIPGVQPRWRKDGKELYFLAKNGDLMAVTVEESDNVLRLGPPRKLFHTAAHPGSGLGTRANYDATRDGSRFIVVEAPDSNETRVVTVLVNWTSALKKQ